jgi:hypothetical protein
MNESIDDRHALYVGWVLGSALRHGVEVRPVLDAGGNYTSRLEVTFPSGPVLTFIVPAPPADWVLE